MLPLIEDLRTLEFIWSHFKYFILMAKASKPAKKRTASKKPKEKFFLKRLLGLGFMAGLWAAIVGAVALAIVWVTLPPIEGVDAVTRKPSATIYARDGSVLATYGELYGSSLTVSDMPDHLIKAVLATEDRKFYYHFGVDPFGIARAMVVNAKAGRVVQGGSTITQQLAKVLFLTPKRSLLRKVRELVLALQLEAKFTKDQILSLYLNRVYLGAGTYGVEAAAQRYFGRSARQVGLYESAVLAGLLRAPSRYNPANSEKRADARAKTVVMAMLDAGFITEQEAHLAKQQSVKDLPKGTRGSSRGKALHFADWVMGQAEHFIGRPSEDLHIFTSLDPAMQLRTGVAIDQVLTTNSKTKNVSEAAMVILDLDGAVLAMKGGRDYRSSQFNRVTQALRQPGSAFKTFAYLAAFEQGWTADSQINDRAVSVKGWKPRNFSGRFYGTVTLREAFARSINTAAVRLSETVGRRNVINTAKKLGITSPLSAAASLPLGTEEVTLLELTGAYVPFANGGKGVWPYAIERIENQSGRLLFERSGGGPGQVLSSTAVQQMQSLLRAVVVWGTGKKANTSQSAGGKTGTSQDYRDAVFVGYNGALTAGVWMGNDDGSPTKKVTGGSLPAEIWRQVMQNAPSVERLDAIY